MGNKFLSFAALSGFISVAFGAFVSHGLQPEFSLQQLNWFDTAWKYHTFHTVALLALGWFISATMPQNTPKCRQTAVNIIGFSWLLGMLLFSGSLYTMAVLNTRAIAMFVPVGGIAFLFGWATLLVVSVRSSFARRATK
ncbi:DUF423 domain-containing protein [Lonepinella koalarum]|uniref:Uncharacterized membrane protein YgdD (TMEM256/DUF423 family) n=2 Tax=Lonepinella koalarum TaxID=53417 RepID=A0A4R1KUE8_9PAST|nr:DUF423 domain-containing protein [Lonepinella koalarum]MDH2927131.1 hypothetical protein [Lonepinella koalarum]TCK68200.1 uncharacterized membrane protein YgdD (TMEM256/DUF423 family) [Lonepinella koalarum]TFJ89410.1 DUF423 domain-containing protein [Lonepinella koalarum]TYG33363.1 DUF423 domain-containing protein [Lonepinella koalarum]